MNTISQLANTYGFQNPQISQPEKAESPALHNALSSSNTSDDTVNISRAALEKLSATRLNETAPASSPQLPETKDEEASEALREKIIELTEYLFNDTDYTEQSSLSVEEEERIDKLYQKIDGLENYGLSDKQIQARDQLDEELGELLEKDNLTPKQLNRIEGLGKALDALQPKLSPSQEAKLDSLYDEVDELESANTLDIDAADFPEIAGLNKELEQYLVAGDTENAQGIIAAMADFVFRDTEFLEQEPDDDAELSEQDEKQIDALQQRMQSLENFGLTDKQIKQRIATYEDLDALQDLDTPNQNQQTRIEQLYSALEKPNPNLSKTQLNELEALDEQLEKIEENGYSGQVDVKDLRSISSLSSDISKILSDVLTP